ncbi:MAG: outer membrane protein assembly factor [Gemmatimonadota bacterium]|nr:outer membrane protein assembly factor [Gemmatimonadota bacterium]
MIAEVYEYGDGQTNPYLWTVQPTVFLTTEGRRDFTVFIDAPRVGERWRLSLFTGSEKQIATPYYGLGNDAPYDPALDAEDGPDPFYYRFGRTQVSLRLDAQRSVGARMRLLAGAGLVRTSLVAVPEGRGTTLFAESAGAGSDPTWANYARFGIIWDSRDRETGPSRGVWTEFLVQVVPEALGAAASYTRWTFTDRRYFPLGSKLVLAYRALLQDVGGSAPDHELFLVQTSFKQQEGIGGAKTVRGLLKNRLVGRGAFVWNTELRWRVADFELLGRSFHTVLSAFVDQGRVWEDGLALGEVFDDLHRGWGGGLRLGMGENFTVAVDAATSEETGLPVYIGLGYLF